MPRLIRRAAALAALAAGAARAQAPGSFNVSNVFGDDGVLQRDASVVVWGWAVPLPSGGPVVSATWVDGAVYSGAADASAGGLFRVVFPPAPASAAPFDVVFSSSAAGLGVPNVTLARQLLGDVILCAGQSNMGAVQVSAMANASDIVAAAPALGAAGLRIFQVSGNLQSPTPSREWPTDGLVPWQPPVPAAGGSNATLLGFSAVCYIAGATLFAEHLGGAVPLGLLHSSHGGTSIQAWQSGPGVVAECGDSSNSWNTSVLYNTNVYPLTVGPAALKAVYYYQGEQDCGIGSSETYYRAAWWGCSVRALVRDWRARLADAGLFFVVQQLHAWLHTADVGLPVFRHGQLKALGEPRVEMPVAFDGGDPAAAMAGQPGGTVHSHLKFIPGRRAAAALAGGLYGLPVAFRAPAYADAVAVSRSNATATALAVTVSFSDVTAAGLVLRGWEPDSNSSHCPTERAIPLASCDWFAIQTNDGATTWHNASVALTADRRGVVLTAVAPQPGLAVVATRFGWADWPVVTVYTAEGLPVQTWNKPLNG